MLLMLSDPLKYALLFDAFAIPTNMNSILVAGLYPSMNSMLFPYTPALLFGASAIHTLNFKGYGARAHGPTKIVQMTCTTSIPLSTTMIMRPGEESLL